MGLASTLALLGVVSTYVGRAYGQIGSGLPIGAHLSASVDCAALSHLGPISCLAYRRPPPCA